MMSRKRVGTGAGLVAAAVLGLWGSMAVAQDEPKEVRLTGSSVDHEGPARGAFAFVGCRGNAQRTGTRRD